MHVHAVPPLSAKRPRSLNLSGHLCCAPVRCAPVRCAPVRPRSNALRTLRNEVGLAGGCGLSLPRASFEVIAVFVGAAAVHRQDDRARQRGVRTGAARPGRAGPASSRAARPRRGGRTLTALREFGLGAYPGGSGLDGRGAGPTQVGGDRGGRRGRLFAADGRRRPGHAATAQGAAQRAVRPQGRRAWRAHLQDHRRRHSDRVPQCRERGPACARCARRPGWTQRRYRPGQSDRAAHRRQPGRHPGRGRRHLWRRRQCRGAFGDAVPTGRGLCLGQRARPGGRQAGGGVRGPGRAIAEEHRTGGPRLSCRGRRPRDDQARHRRGTGASGQAVDRGAAVPEHVGRCRAGILFRRHHRRHHHRTFAGALVLRHRAELHLRLQGYRARHPPGGDGPGRALRAGGRRPQGGQPGAHLGPAHRRRHRQPRLGRTLRPRACRHLRGPGRDHPTVVGAIEPELGRAEQERARGKPPESLRAWDVFQRGMWHLNRRSEDDLEEALRLFRQAIAEAPGLAVAHAGAGRPASSKSAAAMPMHAAMHARP